MYVIASRKALIEKNEKEKKELNSEVKRLKIEADEAKERYEIKKKNMEGIKKKQGKLSKGLFSKLNELINFPKR